MHGDVLFVFLLLVTKSVLFLLTPFMNNLQLRSRGRWRGDLYTAVRTTPKRTQAFSKLKRKGVFAI